MSQTNKINKIEIEIEVRVVLIHCTLLTEISAFCSEIARPKSCDYLLQYICVSH
jgi:hypothetical protein